MARASRATSKIAAYFVRLAVRSGVGVVLLGGCSRAVVPDPKEALRAYQSAAAAGDSNAIYDMLTERSRAALRPADVRRIVSDERVELSSQAKAMGDPLDRKGQRPSSLRRR